MYKQPVAVAAYCVNIQEIHLQILLQFILEPM
jgi:hypothetical protein